MKKIKTTKYFGDVEVNYYMNSAEFVTIFNEQEISFCIRGCKNPDDLEDKLPLFWEAVTQYIEINETAKKAIVEYFYLNGEGPIDESGKVYSFFNEVFNFMEKEEQLEIFGGNDFFKLDIKAVVANMPYPNLVIYNEYGTQLSLCYIISPLERCCDYSLWVNMDTEFKVTGFSAIVD